MPTAYADYTYYTTNYLGTKVAEDDFPSLAVQASNYVDRLTMERVAAVVAADEDEDAIDKVKSAVCAVAETLQDIANGDSVALKSESMGGRSVTYADYAQETKTVEQRVATVVYRWLVGTGLTFRGFESGEEGGRRW